MKPLKSQSRLSKPAVNRSPPRKVPQRKLIRHSPPPMSSSSRPLGMRRSAAGLKHGSPPQRARKRSPHLMSSARKVAHGSPPPMERMHGSKRVHEYEKRRSLSRSPIPRRMPIAPPHGPPRRHMTPPPHMMRNRSDTSPSSHFPPSPKKKPLSREMLPLSPPRRRPEKAFSNIRSESHLVPRGHMTRSRSPPYSHDREYLPSHERPMSHGRPPSPPPPPHSGYMSSGPSQQKDLGYTVDQKRGRDHPRKQYMDESRDKRYAPTLDERFSSEHRMNFSQEDLEKITIDIKRGAREYSPTLRRIVNPAEVKLVRRPEEGSRPIFDREEIKQSPRDMREDAYNERRMCPTSDRGHYSLNYKEMENYEITRHKFDTYRGPPLHTDSLYTLSEKWQRLESHKNSGPSLDRDNGQRYESQPHSPADYPESSRSRRASSVDRDFRHPKPPYGMNPQFRPEYELDSNRPLPRNPPDLRHNLAVRRKDGSLHDARQRILERRSDQHPEPSDYRSWDSPPPRYHDSGLDRPKERRNSGPMHGRPDLPKTRGSWSHERSFDRPRLKEDKFSDYMDRSDKYPSWHNKLDMPPKGNYFEHEGRDPPEHYRSRGSGFRGRNFRGRPFRSSGAGPTRGTGFRSRGPFRSNINSRGRGFAPRRRSSFYGD